MARDLEGWGGRSEWRWCFDADCLVGLFGLTFGQSEEYPGETRIHASDYAGLIGPTRAYEDEPLNITSIGDAVGGYTATR